MNRSPEDRRRILGRVKRAEFVGRTAELDRLVSHATRGEARGLLILLAPLAGVSELLRQAYDELFRRQGDVVPIYFSLPRSETTAVSAAIEFLSAFLLQYVAFRRDEPSLCEASLTLNDLADLAPASDLEWIEELVESYNKQRFGNDDRELVRFCLSAPRRVPVTAVRPFVMLDAVQLSSYSESDVPFATEIIRGLKAYANPFALAGLRREIADAFDRAGADAESFDTIRLEPLLEEDARQLVASAASRQEVAITDESRDLLAYQLEGSPYFLTAILQAAHEKQLRLNSYLDCERLYVDEVLGGRLNRYFTSLLENVAAEPEIRASLVRVLCEAVPQNSRSASFESWRKRLKLDARVVERILRRLHIQELVNWDGETIDADSGPIAWKDFLRSRFRLDALREPRALVVADLMAAALKRAPQSIAQHYRSAAGLRLRELLSRFDSQHVPGVLFDYEQFATVYKGLAPEEISAGLESDTALMKLPQVFHTAGGASFSRELKQFGEEVSAVAHAFEGATYSDANEIVWLSARIESKLEADRTLVEAWCNRLENVARKAGIARFQLWLIASEGFNAEARRLLRERGAFGSSQQQFEILASRLSEGEGVAPQAEENEVMMVLPMGGDYELLAANTVEQLARRLNFRPEAINQIKHAIVEACINASEHSLSPDRKIYQRFRVENDKLVVTISSRGIVPSTVNGHNRELTTGNVDKTGEQRRGWGLKLIKTLMDEVEFERVDEGTSLRMTKYRRS